MQRRTGLALAVGGLVGAFVLIDNALDRDLGRSIERQSGTESVDYASRFRTLDDDGLALERVPLPDTPSGSGSERPGAMTAQAFVEKFWGSRWPEVSSWLANSGHQLPSQVIDFSSTYTYEEALALTENTVLFGGRNESAESFRAKKIELSRRTALWRLEQSVEMFGKVYEHAREYSREDIEGIARQLEPQRRHVTELATVLADLELEIRARAWDEGTWLLHPFAVYEPDREMLLESLAGHDPITVGGSFDAVWSFQAFVSKLGHPHFSHIQKEYFAAKTELKNAEQALLMEYGTPLKSTTK
jgi:hypothetical protein